MNTSLPPRGVGGLWASDYPLIGMIHLPPLPGAPRWGGSMQEVLDRARTDARILTDAGFTGILVENFLDAPFYGETVPPETVSALTLAVAAAREATSLPVGVNVLRNDARAAMAIAAATEARFMRVNVHTGAMWTDQGLLEGRAAETLRLRRSLGADVVILADVLVKHATPPPGTSLEQAARDARQRGLADALIVTGEGTGRPASEEALFRVKDAVPDAPVFVGSGVTPRSAAAMRAVADGIIVGSALARDGDPGAGGVDPEKASALVAAVRDGA
ncbi:MAG: BtpA/SgcQ family protein [Gemmatimonadota bacterium]